MMSNDPKPKNNHEQQGYRPWLVISEELLSKHTPFIWAIPFTSTKRDYPLALDWDSLNVDSKTTGTLLCAQVVSVDFKSRHAKFVEHVEIPKEVDTIVEAILGFAK